jgi:SAM-dependent methyltransferase
MDESAKSPVVSRTLPSRNEFDEDAYRQLYPDVSAAIRAGSVGSGWQHFMLHGFAEGRPWVPKSDPMTDVRREIAAGDEMYRGNEAHYFDVGESALHCIETALFAARRPKSSINRILDLPCGHGRVMRFLQQAFPVARLTACDLDREGVEFCAKTFAALPVISQVKVADIPLEGPYDLIWCGSLLTHLPAEKCAAFLKLFQRLLLPGGILVFTLHGRRCETELTTRKNRCGLDDPQITSLLGDYRRTGFGYVDYSDSPGYGISVALPSFVLANFVQDPEWQLLCYHETGWDKRQDAVCLQRLGQGAAMARQDPPPIPAA